LTSDGISVSRPCRKFAWGGRQITVRRAKSIPGSSKFLRPDGGALVNIPAPSEKAQLAI